MIVDVKLENFYNLESFKNILDKYRDFKSFHRELKINSLLGKKSQFEIEEINPPIICGLESNESCTYKTFSLKDSAFSINSIYFVVEESLNVLKISINIEILKTLNGELLRNIINLVDFRLVVLQSYNNVEIIGFQACSRTSSAA